MAKKENDLYLMIEPENYKASKRNVLNCEVDLLNSLKRLQSIKRINARQKDLNIMLCRLFSSVSADLDKLEEKIPSPHMPKSIQNSETGVSEKKVKRQSNEKMLYLDEELREVQRKLEAISHR